jgi:single-stranded-DNA-specific exonuclease
LRHLAGVGVAYKVCEATLMALNTPTDTYKERALDLVALGTVADVVPLLGENRVMVKVGLEVLSRTRKIGLLALAREANIELSRVRARMVAYGLAPRLNAAGRIDDATVALHLLLTKDAAQAWRLAHEIEISNAKRRGEQDRVFAEADEIVRRSWDPSQKAIVVACSGWNVGVIGIVASKLVDAYNRPAFVIALDGDRGRGSARSPVGLNVVEALEACQSKLIVYGGHARAGGFEIAGSSVEGFRESMLAYAARAFTAEAATPAMEIDLPLDLADIDLALAREISRFEPFGEGNREPTFIATDAIIREMEQMGSGEHVRLRLGVPRSRPSSGSRRPRGDGERGGADSFPAMAFGLAGEMAHLSVGDRIDLCYALDVAEGGGWEEPRLIVRDFCRTR